MANRMQDLQHINRGHRVTPFAVWMKKGVALVRRWQQLSYERRLLASLDDRTLRDVGISRSDAARESARPFWDDKPIPVQREERL